MKALTEIHLPDLPLVRKGKVRNVYDLGAHFLLVASDRISAFDCILPTGIPRKGQVLTQLSAWWFHRLRNVVPHHLVSASWTDIAPRLKDYAPLLAGRSMVVRKAEVIPVECVARGYLAGSAWSEYRQTGSVAGHRLRPGLTQAARLDTPLFTPARKAHTGHDENISYETLVDLVGARQAAALRDLTLRLYSEAAAYAATRGILVADTKFEFGRVDGVLTLVDEALTPDSSRYWPAATYAPGTSPPSYDKQFVRDYLESLAWDKTPPAPALPPDIVERTRAKYVEAYRSLTGQDLPST